MSSGDTPASVVVLNDSVVSEQKQQQRQHSRSHHGDQGDGTIDEISLSSLADIRIVLTERRSTVRRIIWEMLKLAGPAALASFVYQGASALVSIAVGHRLGAEGLEGIAAGITAYNVCSVSLGIGLATGLDTLASQAFGRDKKNPELGELLQRVTIIMALFALPCFAFFYFSGAILPLVFSAPLAKGASEFLNNSYVRLAVDLNNFVAYSIVNACRLTHLPFYGALVNTTVVGLLSYFALHSIAGAAWILAAGTSLNCCVVWFFAVRHPDMEGLRRAKWPLSPNTLKLERFREYFAIAIPSMIACCSEWWSFEAFLLIAASVSDASVGVLTVVFNMYNMFFPIPAGFSRAATTAIGNALGANNPELAKLCALASLLVVFCVQCFDALLVLLFGRFIFQVWTTDEELLSLFPSVHIWIACTIFFDGLQFTLQGSYRGVGKQDMLAKRVLLSLWPVGVGLGYVFSHPLGLGVGGITLGNACGLICEVPLLLHGIKGWDWTALALRASEEKEKEKEEGSIQGESSEETEEETQMTKKGFTDEKLPDSPVTGDKELFQTAAHHRHPHITTSAHAGTGSASHSLVDNTHSHEQLQGRQRSDVFLPVILPVVPSPCSRTTPPSSLSLPLPNSGSCPPGALSHHGLFAAELYHPSTGDHRDLDPGPDSGPGQDPGDGPEDDRDDDDEDEVAPLTGTSVGTRSKPPRSKHE